MQPICAVIVASKATTLKKQLPANKNLKLFKTNEEIPDITRVKTIV